MRYAASLENVMVVLSGMSTPEQVADNVAYMQDFQPLNEEEHALVEQAAEITRKSITIGCTSCRYCTDGCPQSIPIPSLFTVYNDYRRFAALGKSTVCHGIQMGDRKGGQGIRLHRLPPVRGALPAASGDHGVAQDHRGDV